MHKTIYVNSQMSKNIDDHLCLNNVFQPLFEQKYPYLKYGDICQISEEEQFILYRNHSISTQIIIEGCKNICIFSIEVQMT